LEAWASWFDIHCTWSNGIVEWDSDILLADAQEPADAHDEAVDLALAVHQNLVDVADLLVIRAIEVDAHQLRATHEIRWHLGHHLPGPGGLGRGGGLGQGRSSHQAVTARPAARCIFSMSSSLE
jgi:hypothetical protein